MKERKKLASVPDLLQTIMISSTTMTSIYKVHIK